MYFFGGAGGGEYERGEGCKRNEGGREGEE